LKFISLLAFCSDSANYSKTIFYWNSFSLSDSKENKKLFRFISSTFPASIRSVVKCSKLFHSRYLHFIIHVYVEKKRPNMNSSNYFTSISSHINFTFEHPFYMTEKKEDKNSSSFRFQIDKDRILSALLNCKSLYLEMPEKKLEKKETILKLFPCSRNQIDLSFFVLRLFILNIRISSFTCWKFFQQNFLLNKIRSQQLCYWWR